MKSTVFVCVILALACNAMAEEEKKTEKRGLLGLGYGSGYGYGLDHGFGNYGHGLGYPGFGGSYGGHGGYGGYGGYHGLAGYNGLAGYHGDFGHALPIAAPIHTAHALPLSHAPLPIAHHGFYGSGLHY